MMALANSSIILEKYPLKIKRAPRVSVHFFFEALFVARKQGGLSRDIYYISDNIFVSTISPYLLDISVSLDCVYFRE